MNPYLEQNTVWHDFHQSFLPAIREHLAPQVRPTYVVKVEEHIYIHELPEEERRFVGRADVSIAGSDSGTRPQTAVAVLDVPCYGAIPVRHESERLSYLEIRDRESGEIITVIEVLSLSNKRSGPDREQYVSKRLAVYYSSAHLIEIDLLRGGNRMPLEHLPECDYYALVSRAEERPRVGLWPVRLRDRLPITPVPLRAPHADAKLDLQQVLHRVYDAAGYEDYIYRGTPQPPLSAEDTLWAQQLTQSRASGG
jgi:hypothetical protein